MLGAIAARIQTTDATLGALLAAWPSLGEPIRAAVAAMVHSQEARLKANGHEWKRGGIGSAIGEVMGSLGQGGT